METGHMPLIYVVKRFSFLYRTLTGLFHKNLDVFIFIVVVLVVAAAAQWAPNRVQNRFR